MIDVYLNVCRQSEERMHLNTSLEQRFHEMEVHYAEATTLLHLQGTLILDLQVHPSWGVLFHFMSIGHACVDEDI